MGADSLNGTHSDHVTIRREQPPGPPPIKHVIVVGPSGSEVRATTFAPETPGLQVWHDGRQVTDFAFRNGQDLEAFANALLELAWQCMQEEA